MSSPPAVLVAEDDADMRALLALAVERAGHRAETCANGAQLLERLLEARARAAPPALIVADNRMPGRAGIDVAAQVQAWGWSVPFILVTAFPDDELRRDAVRCGVSAVLDKPVSIADMVAMIARCASPAATSAAPVACPYCDEPLAAGGRCDECEPTGEHPVPDELDLLYLDLGDGD